MKFTSLKNKIEKLGGTATITIEKTKFGRDYYTLEGELNGYDIEMFCNGYDDTDFFTVRSIGKRGFHDQGSDYNPGGFLFCHKIKDLAWACKLELAS